MDLRPEGIRFLQDRLHDINLILFVSTSSSTSFKMPVCYHSLYSTISSTRIIMMDWNETDFEMNRATSPSAPSKSLQRLRSRTDLSLSGFAFEPETPSG